jgi:hypothetical protein
MKQNLHLQWVHVDDSNGRSHLEAHWVPEGSNAVASVTTHAA